MKRNRMIDRKDGEKDRMTERVRHSCQGERSRASQPGSKSKQRDASRRIGWTQQRLDLQAESETAFNNNQFKRQIIIMRTNFFCVYVQAVVNRLFDYNNQGKLQRRSPTSLCNIELHVLQALSPPKIKAFERNVTPLATKSDQSVGYRVATDISQYMYNGI